MLPNVFKRKQTEKSYRVDVRVQKFGPVSGVRFAL